jgi:hypothetical protein
MSDKYIEKMEDQLLHYTDMNAACELNQKQVIKIINQIIHDTKEACKKALLDNVNLYKIIDKAELE